MKSKVNKSIIIGIFLISLFLFILPSISAIDISTCEELQNISLDLTEDYVLINDIDCSDTINWNGGDGFYPIGNSTSAPWFAGTFDGQGYTISNLYINRPSTDIVGLFANTDFDGIIQNVGLINVNITGHSYVGGLIGRSDGDVLVNNTYTTGNVIGTGATYVGGLVAYFGYSPKTISNSWSSVDVTGETQVGGLVGYNKGSITNCYATGTVTTTSILNAFVGGLVGSNEATGVITDSYSTGLIVNSTEDALIGGLVGSEGGTTTNSFWDIETSGLGISSSGTGKTTAEMKMIETYTNIDYSSGLTSAWDFVGNPYDDTNNDSIWNLDSSETINNGYPFFASVNNTVLYTLNDVTSPYFTPYYEWVNNQSITAGTNIYGNLGGANPDAFFIGNDLYMLVGGVGSGFGGLAWNGTGWNSNSTITTGVNSAGSQPFTHEVFYKDGAYNLIQKDSGGTYYGYTWNGAGWSPNSSINGTLSFSGEGGITVFELESEWYALIGGSDGYARGYKYESGDWSPNSLINSSIGDAGTYSYVDVFEKDSKFHLVSGNNEGTFLVRKWNGTDWLSTGAFTGLTDVGYRSAPTVFELGGKFRLISGNQNNNRYTGFDLDVISNQIPADTSIFYGNESVSVKFTGDDLVAFNGYSVNDTRFTISSTGTLNETEAVSAGNYQVNVTIDDVAGNINYTLHDIEVKINPGPCNVYTDNSTNLVWTDCSSSYQMYVNGTPISNASTITLGSDYYNISVLRDDAVNYTNYYDEDFLTIPKIADDCSLYFDKVTPQMYPESFTVNTNCNSAYNLSKDGVPISNATTYSLGAGSYDFEVQRDDTQNYSITNDTQTFVISQNTGTCDLFFNPNSPITYPSTFIVWTDCNSAFTLYRDTTSISNNSVQSLAAGTYNFSVYRTDTLNYSAIFSSELFLVNEEEDEGTRGTSEGTFIPVVTSPSEAPIFSALGINQSDIKIINLGAFKEFNADEFVLDVKEWIKTHQIVYVLVGMLMIFGLVYLLNRR